MALIDKLTAIGVGFRSSRGTDQKYTLDEMAVLAAEPEAPPEYGETLTGKITAIANGFRLREGTEQKYTLDEMAILAAKVLKPAVNLPDGYKQVDYVQSNGTQYINLGCNPKADAKIELRCRVIRNSQRDYEALFGTRYQGYETYAYIFFTRFGGQDIPVYNRSGAETKGENFIYDEDITLVCHNKTATWSTDTGDVYSFETTGNVTETMYNMFLFDLNNARYYSGHNPDNSKSVMRVYDLKIYEDDDVLVRHYVPALDADGVPCLYEEVLGTTHYPLSGDALTIPS